MNLSKHSPIPRLYTLYTHIYNTHTHILYSPIPNFQCCYHARGKSIHPVTGTEVSEKQSTVKIQSLITKAHSEAVYVLYVQGTPDRM